MTPLRQRMIEDMQLRNFAQQTQRSYVHHIFHLTRFYRTSPDQLILEDVREYQLYLINQRRYSPDAVNQFVSAAKFFYSTTCDLLWPENALPRARVPHKLPVVLSPEEVELFFAHIPVFRYRAALMIGYGAGLRVSEIVSLKVADIDSKRGLIRVEQGKGKKDRYAMLSPRLVEVLRIWWRADQRNSQPHDPTDWLFPGLRTGRRLNQSTLQLACREAARKAGISKRVTVHTLRHYAASRTMPRGSQRKFSKGRRTRVLPHTGASQRGIVRRHWIRVV